MAGEKREAFVFYRSYYEAMQFLSPEDRLIIYESIFAYALNDEVKETDGVPSAVFMLIKPTLDAHKQRSERGKAGGEAKAAKAAKAKAASKQSTSSEKDVAIKDKGQGIKDKGQETRDKGQETRDEEQERTASAGLSAAQTEKTCPFGKIPEGKYNGRASPAAERQGDTCFSDPAAYENMPPL